MTKQFGWLQAAQPQAISFQWFPRNLQPSELGSSVHVEPDALQWCNLGRGIALLTDLEMITERLRDYRRDMWFYETMTGGDLHVGIGSICVPANGGFHSR